MKKIIAAVTALLLALSVTACSGVGTDNKPDGNDTTKFTVPEFTMPDIEIVKAKTFDSNGLKITLNEKFKEAAASGYTVVLESDSAALFALKESFDSLEGFADYTLEEYADLVYQANVSKSPKEFEKIDGLLCMEYSFFNADENQNYSYIAAVFKGSDAFWTVQFACEEENYEELKPSFLKWLGTVEL